MTIFYGWLQNEFVGFFNTIYARYTELRLSSSSRTLFDVLYSSMMPFFSYVGITIHCPTERLLCLYVLYMHENKWDWAGRV